MTTELITFTRPLTDANGTPISEGSVLQHVLSDDRGVVTWVGREGFTDGPAMAKYGDIAVRTSSNSLRVSNQYHYWKHVPHDEQTYMERFLSHTVQKDPYLITHNQNISEDERKAITGIMALLPSNTVSWEMGPYPDTLNEALHSLTQHLTHLQDHIDLTAQE